MLHKRKTNKRIEHLRERVLWIVYHGQISYSFEQLLEYRKSDFIHHRNVQRFGVKLFNAKNNLSTQTMNEIFQFREIN